MRAPAAWEDMDDIGNVVVATRGGVPVRVKDIAEVRIGRDCAPAPGARTARRS